MGKKGLIAIAVVVTLVMGMALTLSSAKNDRKIGAETKERIEQTTTDMISALGLEDKIQDYEELEYTEALKLKGSANKEIRDLIENIPAGSSMPTYYVGVDGSKVIVIYQEPDGTNVAKMSAKEGEQWARSEERGKNGKEEKKASE